MVILETRDGKRITVAIEKLSDEDQDYIAELGNASSSDKEDRDSDDF